jgi:hypothetical protein
MPVVQDGRTIGSTRTPAVTRLGRRMTRDVARRLALLLLRASSASAVIAVAGGAVTSCYTGGGGGTDPPADTFYFPVGLAVSSGGNALYAVNSDFDLQWNGGTLQSYDLFLIRLDAAKLVQTNLTLVESPRVLTDSPPYNSPYNIDFVSPPSPANCLSDPSAGVTDTHGTRVPPGEICAPPVQSTNYVRSSAIIGAFATTLQLQTFDGVDQAGCTPPECQPQCMPPNCGVGHRLFAPVRGDASLTWADVGPDDDPNAIPPEGPHANTQSFAPFQFSCVDPGTGSGCIGHAGNSIDPEDTRGATMPGEPFGLSQTQDGTAIAVTHQTSTDTSLLTAGMPPSVPPSMQFVETDLPNAGSGITFVPHDPESSVPPCKVPPIPGVDCVRPAFLETNHSTAEVDLLRFWDDDGAGPGDESSNHRPFIVKDAFTPINTNLGGSDSRGIAIDPTPRLACKALVPPTDTADRTRCADLPARVFIANRTPPSLIIGEVGGPSPNGSGTYDPDLLTLTGNLTLPAGPSTVYVAPIVNSEGRYEVRVFVVNFDSSTISVYDPDSPNLALVDTIYVGPGPFAMAFDPFVLNDVATHAAVPLDTRKDPRLSAAQQAMAPPLKRYRFAYVASFTQSYVQVIDLDQSQPTFESVAFTLGNPTPPKGS